MAFFTTILVIFLQLSAIWAAPAPESTKTISIPIADIANGTLGRHEGHPVFPLYLHWLETSVHGSWVARNAKAGALATEPHLTSIDCNLERGNCHFVSTFQLDDVVGLPIDLALGFENTRKDALGQSEGDALLGKRDATTQSWSADHLYTETHFKTYHDIDDHHAGFEHYVAWNMFVSRLLDRQNLQISKMKLTRTNKNVVQYAQLQQPWFRRAKSRYPQRPL